MTEGRGHAGNAARQQGHGRQPGAGHLDEGAGPSLVGAAHQPVGERGEAVRDRRSGLGAEGLGEGGDGVGVRVAGLEPRILLGDGEDAQHTGRHGGRPPGPLHLAHRTRCAAESPRVGVGQGADRAQDRRLTPHLGADVDPGPLARPTGGGVRGDREVLRPDARVGLGEGLEVGRLRIALVGAFSHAACFGTGSPLL
jgi:hypothetical protein